MKRLALRSAGFALILTGALACISAAQSRDYLYEIDGIQTVVPGTRVQLFFVSENGSNREDALHVRVYRLTPALALEAVRRNAVETVPQDILAQAIVQSQFTSSERLADDKTVRVADLGRLPIGEYAATVQYGDATTVTRLLNISTLGIVRVHQADQTLLWAVDLRSFRSHSGPTQAQLLAGAAQSGVTFVDSLAHQTGALPSDSGMFASTADGSITAARFSDWNARPSELTYCRLDRPLYRPGQDVYFRAVVRRGAIGAYTIPVGLRRVRVTDPNDVTIYDHTLPVDSFGSIHGTIALPEDAQLGWYQMHIGDADRGFSVQTYKKPEYEISVTPKQRFIIRGDRATFDSKTSYFFGRPAAGLHIHYSVFASGYGWFEDSPYNRFMNTERFGSNRIAEGDGRTSDSGEYGVSFRAPSVSSAESVSVNVEARDASGRTVSESAYATIVPASVRIAITPSSWFAQAGDRVGLSFRSEDYAGHVRPNTDIALEIVRTEWDQKKRQYADVSHTNVQLRTTPQGVATYSWRPDAAGAYEIRAAATDERGNRAVSRLPIWVESASETFVFGSFEQPAVIAARTPVAPGERPRVLIALPRPDRDVLVTVSTDRLVSARVIHVAGYAASYAFDAPADARHVAVTVSLPQENGIVAGEAGIEIAPAAKLLRIALLPSKARYAPGERARFQLHVSDRDGNPVRAQLSLGVVDAALLALAGADSGGSIAGTFYGNAYGLSPDVTWSQPNRKARRTIANVTSHAAGTLVKPGVTADIYSVNAGTTQAITALNPRSKFADTAYWTPAIVTDAHGNGTVSFTWPDNLTRWVADSAAVTTSTAVGEARTTALVTKDFLVRLETPRFLRKGDTVAFVGIAHGMSAAPNVRLRLDDGTDPLDSLLTLDHTLSADAAWQIHAGADIGTRTFTLSGSDGERTDAMRLSLPVEAVGAAEHVRDAGKLPDRAGTSLALPAGYDAGALHIALTPSLVAQLVQDVRLLDVYPYYCTEQTMSAALPAVFVDRVLARSHLARPSDMTSGIVAKAIRRLAQLQHWDGSWGWWENDQNHPFMTAYALFGLAEFRHARYAVPSDVFSKGVDSLVSQLQQSNRDTLAFWGGAQSGSEWNTRAFMIYALADAAPHRVDPAILRQTDTHAASLNAYAIAVLGLAHHLLGQDDVARALLDRLNARELERGPYTYWSGQTWHYAWEDDPIETTAYALRLNVALQPHSSRVQRIVDFLRAEQHGSWWYTTKDTAAAIYAISEAVPARSDEFSPDETIGIRIDGKLVRNVRITTPILDAGQAQIVIGAPLIHPGAVVTFEQRGRGALYWATDWLRYAPPDAHAVADPNSSLLARLFPKEPPLRIARHYSWGHRGPWAIGDEISVDVTVQAKSDLQYVAIEDPLPAGVEYEPPQGETGQDWSGMQYFDDRVVFFATRIDADSPLRLHYSVRATNAGWYTAPAPIAYAMYGPPISAAGDMRQIVVR